MADASPSCTRMSEAIRRRRFRLALLIFACWLIATSAALFHFEFQPLRPFQSTVSSALSAPPPSLTTLLPVQPTGRPTVVHLLDASCDCLRYTGPHLTALQDAPDFLAADHIVVNFASGGPEAFSPQALLGPAEYVRTAVLDVPVRTPAVAIFDARQNLSYYGPYSLGPACGRAGDTVIPVLEALHAGGALPEFDLSARTCFCDPSQILLTASLSAGGAASK